MPYFIIEDFHLGEDSRKSKATLQSGALWSLVNGHISRGGEIEKRKDLVDTFDLPADTFGLANIVGALYVFGSVSTPVGIPVGITYQRLQHPDGTTAMSKVLMVEVFNGKPYVAAEFADASIEHYYDGSRVTDWFDGRARGHFEIVEGTANSGVAATTQFQITGGTSNPGTNKVSSITIAGIEVLSVAVDWVTSHAATATAVAAQIASFTSSPNWTASASGTTVTITHPSVGSANNGLAVMITVGGDVTTTSPPVTAGGVNASSITSVTVNGVEVLGATVNYASTATGTAANVASQINTFTSTPEYTAAAEENVVFVIAASSAHDTPNGFEIGVTTTGSVTIDAITAMAGGQPSGSTFTPGSSVRTVKTKLYSTSESFLHFSAVNDPTKYNTDATGAGFVNMATNAAGSEELICCETYYNWLAIFAKLTIQIWEVFADDSKNTQIQVLKKTGAFARRAVLPFDDGYVLYLAINGVRALKPRDASNVAVVTEIGSPIDTLVTDYMATLDDSTLADAIMVTEPVDNRLWVVIGTKIYAYSAFPGAGITAWSEYDAGFTISDVAVVNRKLYVRSADKIYLYGGSAGATYADGYTVTIVLPFIDGKTFASFKQFLGVDIACEGTWTLEVATDPSQPDAYETVAIFTGPTMSAEISAFVGDSTHVSARLTHTGSGYARVSKIAFHYMIDEAG